MENKDEFYLDNLLKEFGKEPPLEEKRRVQTNKKAKDVRSQIERFDSLQIEQEEPEQEKSEEKIEETAFVKKEISEVFLEDQEREEGIDLEKTPAVSLSSALEDIPKDPLEEEHSFFSSQENNVELEEDGELFEESIGIEELFAESDASFRDDPPSFERMEENTFPLSFEPDVNEEEKEEGSAEEKEKNNKESKGFFTFFKKLFSNVPLTEEELNALPTPEQELDAEKEKAEQVRLKKEEKKAKAELKKKQKAEDAKKKAAENKAKKKAKEEAKKEAKKNAELRRLRAEAAFPPEGKINKTGAFLVILFFLLVGAFVIFGSAALSYDIKIAGASYRFEKKEYNEAFERIRGLKVKEKDMELQNKIYTVMFVNKQLNSYNNFYAMGDYANALDSLVKGLYRYDKYITYATQIGIKSDLNYVRKQIMAELSETYGMSERDALVLMGISDKQEYSEQVYERVAGINKKPESKEKEEAKEFVP